MERSNSSDNGRDDPDFGIFCFCGEPAPLRKSAAQNNPGRRFFGCSKYETREDCGFFCWYEPSVCQDRSDLGTTRVWTRTQALRTDEQFECSDKYNKKKKTLMVMDHSIWRNLPPEIIDHVLSLLPVKFLCRLKCVSSKWNSLISSPNFAKTHRHITNNTPNKPQKTLLISSSHDFYSINFAAVNPTAEKIDFGLTVRDPTDFLSCLGSCNGLVLVAAQDFSFYDLFLLNPFTRECKKLPNSPLFDCCGFNNDDLAIGFGYDSSADDYKVVMLRCRDSPLANEMAVYSLKTDAWRKIQDIYYRCVIKGHVDGVFLNERLHWLCKNTNGSTVVVAFDLCDEIIREVNLPTTFPSSYSAGTFRHSLSVVAGSCLCLVISPYFEKGKQIDVWMMMKYGVRESWTKCTLMIPSEMFLRDVLYLASEEEVLLRMTEELVRLGPEKLVVFNPKQGKLRDMLVCGIPTEYTAWGNYFETPVSPYHRGQIWRNYEATLG